MFIDFLKSDPVLFHNAEEKKIRESLFFYKFTKFLLQKNCLIDVIFLKSAFIYNCIYNTVFIDFLKSDPVLFDNAEEKKIRESLFFYKFTKFLLQKNCLIDVIFLKSAFSYLLGCRQRLEKTVSIFYRLC